MTHFEIWDVRTAEQIERVSFDSASLSPHEVDPEYMDVAHRLRVFKGKVFLLVSVDVALSVSSANLSLGPF